MTALPAVLLGVAGVLAVGDWVARGRHNLAPRVRLQAGHDGGAAGGDAQPHAGARRRGRRWWFVAAVALSLVGDVLLMLPADRFVAGLAAFLVGHVCYVAGFWSYGPDPLAFGVAAVVVVVVVAPIAVRILGALRSTPGLRGPVAIYMGTIAVMLATALALRNPLAGVGAALFVASDAMIAWNRFVTPFAVADVGIMVTYHLGQAGLVLSLLH